MLYKISRQFVKGHAVILVVEVIETGETFNLNFNLGQFKKMDPEELDYTIEKIVKSRQAPKELQQSVREKVQTIHAVQEMRIQSMKKPE